MNELVDLGVMYPRIEVTTKDGHKLYLSINNTVANGVFFAMTDAGTSSPPSYITISENQARAIHTFLGDAIDKWEDEAGDYVE